MDEGDRTLDRRSHNPELYQLSYVHHKGTRDARLYLERLFRASDPKPLPVQHYRFCGAPGRT